MKYVARFLVSTELTVVQATNRALEALSLDLAEKNLIPTGEPVCTLERSDIGEYACVRIDIPARHKRRGRAVCGTDGGYHHHRRQLQEDPCQPCKDAHSVSESERTARVRMEEALRPKPMLVNSDGAV